MQTIRRLLAALAIVAILVGGVSIAAVLIFGGHSAAPPPTATPRTTLAPAPPSLPTPKEFTINVVVTEQNCEPGPGCVYKYTIEPKYIGFHPLPATPFTVKYEVQGGNLPQPGEFTVEGNQAKILKDVVMGGQTADQLQSGVMQAHARI